MPNDLILSVFLWNLRLILSMTAQLTDNSIQGCHCIGDMMPHLCFTMMSVQGGGGKIIAYCPVRRYKWTTAGCHKNKPKCDYIVFILFIFTITFWDVLYVWDRFVNWQFHSFIFSRLRWTWFAPPCSQTCSSPACFLTLRCITVHVFVHFTLGAK